MVFRLFIILIAAIMIAEWAVIFILDAILAFLPHMARMFLDGIILAVVLFPVLYWTVFRRMMSEITGRERIEKELNEQNKINEQNKLLGDVTQGIEEQILLLSKDLKILWANNKFLEMTGKTIEDITGDHCYKVTHRRENPCEAPFDICPIEEVINTGKSITVEHNHFDKEGDKVLVEVTCYPVRDEKGEIVKFVHLSRDITGRKQAEKEKEKLHAQFLQSQKMAAIGQLAGGVAHEINNPLGVILGFSQSIVKRIKEDDPLYMPLRSIEREAVRCKKLVIDLLTFSRVGKTAAEMTDINTTIDETLSLIEEQAKERNVEIVKEYARNLPQISVNKSQFWEVVVNLCSNAIDAMPGGGKITIATKQDNNQIEIDIADTGQGMTEEVKKHIFEPFFTTKEVGGGTGLGLSLCYEIIQKHNGTIEVESEADKGTVFAIKLPFAAG